jgi:hypothetical protein
MVCYQGKCDNCGDKNQPCCPTGKSCLNLDKQDSTRTECKESLCQQCGSSGYQACDNDPKCLPANLLNNNICYPCGGFNNTCCNKNSGVDYDCDAKAGLFCNLGFCQKK